MLIAWALTEHSKSPLATLTACSWGETLHTKHLMQDGQTVQKAGLNHLVHTFQAKCERPKRQGPVMVVAAKCIRFSSLGASLLAGTSSFVAAGMWVGKCCITCCAAFRHALLQVNGGCCGRLRRACTASLKASCWVRLSPPYSRALICSKCLLISTCCVLHWQLAM